jgi:Undecaprenyl-phosphate glucose phosphotransferase
MSNNDRGFTDSPRATFVADTSRVGPAPKTSKTKRTLAATGGFAALTAFSDVGALAAALIIAAAIQQRFFVGITSTAPATIPSGICVATLFLLLNMMQGEYSVSNYLSLNGHGRRLLLRWNIAFLYLIAFALAVETTPLVSQGAVIFFVLGLGAVYVTRVHFVQIARAGAQPGGPLARRVVVIGHEEAIKAFSQHTPSMSGIHVVSTSVLHDCGSLQIDLERASASARMVRPDDIIILVPWSHQMTIDACVDAFRTLPVSIHLYPERAFMRYTGACWSKLGLIPSFRIVRQPLSPVEVFTKRLFDAFAAGVGLLLLSPLFLMVALIIKLNNKGPVFFKQRRRGFNKEVFWIFKFRSMTTVEDDENLTQATRNDIRITKLGHWLRRSNIDELPQLINILRGEMSLVGPRPHALSHDNSFEQKIALYARRHNVKPGMTGWAQVNGFRGEIRDDNDIRGRLDHDFHYIDNWSFWFDLRILWLTIVSAKAYRNAY